MVDTTKLKAYLDKLYETYYVDYLATDPLWVVRRFSRPEDQEIIGIISSSLAYGQVSQIQKGLDILLRVMDYSPYEFILSFDPVKDRGILSSFKHRFTTGEDMLCLFYLLKEMIMRAGSIEGFYMEGYKRNDVTIRPSLDSFVKRALSLPYPFGEIPEGVYYLLPFPHRGSPCKRLNLFLRWMVRSDKLDLGLWKDIPPYKLIIPLDTHIARISRYIGLTIRKSRDWKMAEEITERLKLLDPEDPVKYDFALSRLGILDQCQRQKKEHCDRCHLRGICLVY